MKELLIEDRGPVRFMRINKPEKRNAISNPLIEAMITAVEEAERTPSLSVVVVGAVGDHFCSGYDMEGHEKKKLGDTKLGIVEDIQRIRKHGERWRRIWESSIPVITAVRGYCLAGGTDFVLHTDQIVCGRSAQFGFPAVRHQGVAPTNMWMERVGMSWAKRLLLTGDLIGAETAARIGMVIEVVDDDKVDEAALALANRMALIDKELLMANKLSLNIAADATGRGIVQQIAALMDAVGHRTNSITKFWERVEKVGIRDVWKEQNARFGKQKPL